MKKETCAFKGGSLIGAGIHFDVLNSSFHSTVANIPHVFQKCSIYPLYIYIYL